MIEIKCSHSCETEGRKKGREDGRNSLPCLVRWNIVTSAGLCSSFNWRNSVSEGARLETSGCSSVQERWITVCTCACTDPCPVHIFTLVFLSNTIMSHYRFPSDIPHFLLPSGLRIKVYAFPTSPMRAACSFKLILLNLITVDADA